MAQSAVAFYPKSVAQIGVSKTLRNTYLLLSMSLLFCGLCAYVSSRMGLFISSPWLFLIGFLGFSWGAQVLCNSVWGLAMVFGLTGFTGLYLAPILLFASVPGGKELVITAAGGTGAIFLGLSGYVLVTRKNFNFLGGMICVGFLVAFLAMLASIVFQMQALSLAVSAAFMFLSAAGILHATSRMVHDPSTNYIVMTVTLFVYIYNIFITLLHLLSFSRD